MLAKSSTMAQQDKAGGPRLPVPILVREKQQYV